MNLKTIPLTLAIMFLTGCVMVPIPKTKPPKNELGKAFELYNGIRVKNDYKQAIDIATKVCNANDLSSPYGCFLVGFGYYNGKGVAKDYQKAFEYFSKGCEVNKIEVKRFDDDDDIRRLQLKYSQRACYMVGKMYENGLSVNIDYIKAFEAYQKAFIAKTKKIVEKKNIEEEKPTKLSKTMRERQIIQEGIKTPIKKQKQAEEEVDFNIELVKFPDLESNLSREEVAYVLRKNEILNHQFRKENARDTQGNFVDNIYQNTPLNIQEGTDIGFFLFNDYILSLKDLTLKIETHNDVSKLLDWRIKQIKHNNIYKNKNTNQALDEINKKVNDSWFVQEGTLYSLKNESRSEYEVFLGAIINKNSKIDLNKAIAFYDYLIKLDEKMREKKCAYSPSCKAPRRDIMYADKILIYAYEDVGRMAYMNKGVANEMLYSNSKNQTYLKEASNAYGKACDLGYVLGCTFYKNLIDGLNNIPEK